MHLLSAKTLFRLVLRNLRVDLELLALLVADEPLRESRKGERPLLQELELSILLIHDDVAADAAVHVGADDVPPLDRPVDGLQRRVAVPQRLHALFDTIRVHFDGLRLHTHVPVAGQIDAGLDGHREPRDQRLFGNQLVFGPVDGIDVFLLQRLFVGNGQEVVDRLVEEHVVSQVPLQDGARDLTLAEARHLYLGRQTPEGGVYRLLHACVFHLDFELDLTLRQPFC